MLSAYSCWKMFIQHLKNACTKERREKFSLAIECSFLCVESKCSWLGYMHRLHFQCVIREENG